MASITKRGERWRAQVKFDGNRETKTFVTKAAAKAWTIERENAMRQDDGIALAGQGKTFGDALIEYASKVSPKKRGAQWELVRLKLIGRHDIAKRKLVSVRQEHMTAWRDDRLKQVSPSSVARELNLISHVLTTAVKEWRWIAASPLKGVGRPLQAPHRERRISEDELAAILAATGYQRDQLPVSKSERIGVALLLAIETAMRAGELCGIRREHVRGSVVHLPRTKNGTARDVPLSVEAERLLGQLLELGDDPLLGMTPTQLDALWRKARDRAGVVGLTFHDSRHEAITRLAKKLDVLTLARIVGHRDIRMLQRYFNPTNDELVAKLRG